MNTRRTPVFLGLFLALGGPAVAGAQARVGYEPDPTEVILDSPPSPADVLGFALGERFTDHAGVVRYMEALAGASPRVRVERYGETVEGRPLVQVVIAREDHLAELEAILTRNRELANPALPERRAREIAAGNPAILYLSYGVHGNESSSSEAALWTAWDLARDAVSVAGVLDSAIVVIDPAANPDGRDRYVNWYRQARGTQPNPNANAWEHWEPWPGGRFNHYLFDLNRDWAWATQPETQARLATWSRWRPQVHVDFHEMNWTSSYFFFPATAPVNPIYPEHILKWGRYFGEANAAAFDRVGELYYTGEGYDLFYPGYGDSWPSLLGAIGMTYEQAGGGRAGQAVVRSEGSVLTLAHRAENHRLTGEATLAAAARRKTELLLDFAAFHRTSGEGAPDILLLPGEDPGRLDALLQLLRFQGVRVERADRAFRANAMPHAGFATRREFPAGTLRVPASQPRGRLALTLLQPETVLDASFSYDVTAWSLPYAYGVEAHRVQRVPSAGWEVVDPAEAGRAAGTEDGGLERNGAEPYGYLLPPGFGNWPGVIRFLAAGGRASMLAREFTIEGRRWPAGTLLLARSGGASLAGQVHEAGLEGAAVPVSTGLATEGPDLGTGNALRVATPRLAVLSGDGVNPVSFGAHWFFLERTLGLAFDPLPIGRLEDVRLSEYDILVLPETNANTIDERRAQTLRDWVRRGGTLIGVGSGARAVATTVAGLSLREPEPDTDADRTALALRGRGAREQDRWDDEVNGAILPVLLDPTHPLTFGAAYNEERTSMFVLHRGGIVFEPEDGIESVAYFADPLEKVSGVISRKNLERLAHGSWLVTRRIGQGRIILFADDPVFRHFWYGTFQPYANALMIGPRL